jgi:hypothetical protein
LLEWRGNRKKMTGRSEGETRTWKRNRGEVIVKDPYKREANPMATSARPWISTLILPEERVTSLGNGNDSQRRSGFKKIDHINCPATFMSSSIRSEECNEYIYIYIYVPHSR